MSPENVKYCQNWLTRKYQIKVHRSIKSLKTILYHIDVQDIFEDCISIEED